MEILRLDLNDRSKLDSLGYDSNVYFCGNYSMQKYYSYIYNFLKGLGVRFALNRACFIHDLNYKQKPNLREKIKIDWIFYQDMQKCIIYEYRQSNIKLKHALYLRVVAMIFYLIVVLATPFYIRSKKDKK